MIVGDLGLQEDAHDTPPLPLLAAPLAHKDFRMHELPFKISSFCHGGGCVGVAPGPQGSVIVINTTSEGQGRLSFTATEWDAFVDGMKNGEFDRAELTRART